MSSPWIIGALVVTSLVGSVALAVFVLVRLPSTYFAGHHRASLLACEPAFWRSVGLVAKNVCGVLLVLLGLVLSIPGVPGQGLLTILVGLILVDLPGKRGLERRILRVPAVRRSVDRMRRRYGREPFELEDDATPS